MSETKKEFKPIMPKLCNYVSDKEVRPGVTEKDVAKRISDIYFEYTFDGLVLPTYSALDCVDLPSDIQPILNALRQDNILQVKLPQFDNDILAFGKMPATEVVKLVLAEMYSNQKNNAVAQQVKDHTK